MTLPNTKVVVVVVDSDKQLQHMKFSDRQRKYEWLLSENRKLIQVSFCCSNNSDFKS